jgi:hypothetical protein
MKLVNVLDLGVVVELYPDDCLAIADALAHVAAHADLPANHPQLSAMQTAFRAMAILAASDTNLDEKTPAREWFRKTREVWANIDTSSTTAPKLTEEPR